MYPGSARRLHGRALYLLSCIMNAGMIQYMGLPREDCRHPKAVHGDAQVHHTRIITTLHHTAVGICYSPGPMRVLNP